MHKNWSSCRLKDLIAIRHGYAFASEFYAERGPYVLLTPGNFHEEGGFRWLGEKQKFYTGPVPKAFVLKPGDMLVAMTEQAAGLLGSTLFVPNDGAYLHNQRLGAVDLVDRSKLTLEYLHHLMTSTAIRREISADAGGTKVRHTSPAKLLALEVKLPPLNEQKRVAEILNTWDSGIEKTSSLRSSVQARFYALQEMLFGATAIEGNSWNTSTLAQISARVRRKADGAQHPIMTISGKHGFLRQDEKFSRYMAGVSVDNYTLLLRGEFAYNKGNSKTYPQGCIYRLDQVTALVPHVYISFRLNAGLNSDFYASLFQAGYLNRQLSRLINSGVRNDGLLNLNSEDFFTCEVPTPPIDQQIRISEVMLTAKREIAILDREIHLLRSQKRGLMQKLLTGEWRVPVRDGDVDGIAARVAEEAAQ